MREPLIGVRVVCAGCGAEERIERIATADEPGGALPEGWLLARRSHWTTLEDFCSLGCLVDIVTGDSQEPYLLGARLQADLAAEVEKLSAELEDARRWAVRLEQLYHQETEAARELLARAAPNGRAAPTAPRP